MAIPESGNILTGVENKATFWNWQSFGGGGRSRGGGAIKSLFKKLNMLMREIAFILTKEFILIPLSNSRF